MFYKRAAAAGKIIVDLKRLGIVSLSKTYDYNHDQPVLRDSVQLPQGVKIELASKKGYSAARLYSNTDDGEELGIPSAEVVVSLRKIT